MKVTVSVTPASETGAKKCPRCLRYHSNDDPVFNDGIICWRCQDVLCHDAAISRTHPAVVATIQWRETHNLPT